MPFLIFFITNSDKKKLLFVHFDIAVLLGNIESTMPRIGTILTIRLSKENDKLFARFPDELGQDLKVELTPLLVLRDDLDRFLKPIITEMQLTRPHTIQGRLAKLRALGEGLTQLGIDHLPESEAAWQDLSLRIHHFVITRTDSRASLQTRQSYEWGEIRRFFSNLIDDGLMPISVYLPPARKVLSSIDISPYRDRLLGQRAPETVNATAKIDKLLMTISLARTDSQYLDDVRDTLAFRRRVLFDVLTDYWITLKANLHFGRSLIESVDWPSLKNEVENIGKRSKTAEHPANPLKGRTGLSNYLAIIKYEYGGCPPGDFVLSRLDRSYECLPRDASLGPIKNWLSGLDAPPNFLGRHTRTDRHILWWWQGRISRHDVSAIAALLIMLHPSWTPNAVLHAKVTNRDGKQYLDFSDNGAIYEVDKPRAKAMKEELLDPIAYDIVSTLIDMGEALRKELRQANDPRASLLMIPWGREKVSRPSWANANRFLSGNVFSTDKSLWIGLLYPQLNENGMGAGTISLSKIRATEGVLEWFRTKSLKAVSKKLGNTVRVVLQHYIPGALLDAWNIRMVRRYQTLWISVSAANEDFLLDVTDFANFEDLHSFLADMLHLHKKNSSPLASILHERFDPSPDDIQPDGHLHIPISRSSLGALYCYQAQLIELGLPDALLDKADSSTHLSPRHFLSLADLLQSRLPKDKDPNFRRCHELALELAAQRPLGGTWCIAAGSELK
jgi:hypothetical protein